MTRQSLIRISIPLLAVLALVGAAAAQMPDMHHGMTMPGVATPTAPLAPASKDTRQTVYFPPQIRQATLREMRDHLASISDIQAALSRSDFALAARIADQRLGLSSTQHGGMMASVRYMPAGMRELGYAMHRSASRFVVAAQDASVSGDVRPALAALTEVTQNCVACHAAYKLR